MPRLWKDFQDLKHLSLKYLRLLGVGQGLSLCFASSYLLNHNRHFATIYLLMAPADNLVNSKWVANDL